PTISLVGYTNAGKTTLFNILTGKQKQADSRPFTTLDTVTGRIKNFKFPVIVCDTIGFISDLPPFLIEAFKTTLLQTLRADLIFHIVDISDKKWQEKTRSVSEILDDLGIENRKVVFVLNKIDQLGKEVNIENIQNTNNGKIFFISAKNKQGINNLLSFLNEYFSNRFTFNY
ncbi:MAG: GTPase, partial [Microgenomates group bacterium]